MLPMPELDSIFEAIDSKLSNLEDFNSLIEAVKDRQDVGKTKELLDAIVQQIKDGVERGKMFGNKVVSMGRLFEKMSVAIGLVSELDDYTAEVLKFMLQKMYSEGLWDPIHAWGADWGMPKGYSNTEKDKLIWKKHHQWLLTGFQLYHEHKFTTILQEVIQFVEERLSVNKSPSEANLAKIFGEAKEIARKELDKDYFNFLVHGDIRNRCRLYKRLMEQASILSNKRRESRVCLTTFVEKLFLEDKVLVVSLRSKERSPFTASKKVIENLLVHAAHSRFTDAIGWVKKSHFGSKVPSKAWEDALWVAAHEGCDEAVRKLLSWENLKVNTLACRTNPLHVATKMGHASVVRLLCQDARIPAHLMDEDEKTALDLARELKHKDIEENLLRMINAADHLYKDRQVYVDAANAILVGAALIASVTFAGWLQPPLGYTSYYQFTEPFPAPPNTYESYVSVEGHMSIQLFAVFNSLSFFLAIATVLAGADATFPVENVVTSAGNHLIRTMEVSLNRLRMSLELMTILFISSVVCVLAAFTSAGFAVIPPLKKYNWNIIITTVVGATVCIVILLRFILFRIFKSLELVMLKWFRRLDEDEYEEDGDAENCTIEQGDEPRSLSKRLVKKSKSMFLQWYRQ